HGAGHPGQRTRRGLGETPPVEQPGQQVVGRLEPGRVQLTGQPPPVRGDRGHHGKRREPAHTGVHRTPALRRGLRRRRPARGWAGTSTLVLSAARSAATASPSGSTRAGIRSPVASLYVATIRPAGSRCTRATIRTPSTTAETLSLMSLTPS